MTEPWKFEKGEAPPALPPGVVRSKPLPVFSPPPPPPVSVAPRRAERSGEPDADHRLGVFLVVDADGQACRCLAQLHAFIAPGLASLDAGMLDGTSMMHCPRGPHRVVEYVQKSGDRQEVRP